MATRIKYSTAQSIVLGPFLDASDGKTPLTGLAGTMMVRVLSQPFGSWASLARNSASTITHVANGYYSVPVDITDTAAHGLIRYYVNNPTVHLPVWCDYECIDPMVWDALIPMNDSLIVDASPIAGLIVESQGSYTLQQALSIILAAVAGVTTDNGTTIKTPNGSATRIAATVNGAANERTAITLTPSS